MKKFGKFLFKLILFSLIVAAIGTAALGFYGFKAYQATMDDYPLNKKVEFIKDDPDYVSRDDVSKYYLDAVIAVEDSRSVPVNLVDIGQAIQFSLIAVLAGR